MSRTYYSLVDAGGYIELSQFTTNKDDPRGYADPTKSLLADVVPEYDPLTQRVNRLEPIPHGTPYVPYEIVPLVPQAPGGTKLTKLSFRNRFTMEEKVAIELASLDNPAADQAKRANQAALRVYLRDIEAASYIDLNRADVIVGVNTLGQFGLIAAARVTEILTSPVTASEI